MATAGPDDFARRLAAAFSSRDGGAIAALCTGDAAALTLSGAWAEGPAEIAAAWATDLAGPLAGSRLVTGKGRLMPITAQAAQLHQRFVLSGLTDGAGAELGRVGVILSALLVAAEGEWLARSLVIAPLS